MAKSESGGLLNRMKGKTVVFSGKFGYGEEDQLKAMAQAQQAKVADDLDASTSYLILADITAGKTIQKKVLTLNGKGASIQVISAADFEKLVQPTIEELISIIKDPAKKGWEFFNALTQRNPYVYQVGGAAQPKSHSVYSIANETFDGLDLANLDFRGVDFESCSFVGCNFINAAFRSSNNCNFTDAKSKDGFTPGETRNSIFKNAQLPRLQLTQEIDHADFSGASIEKMHIFNHWAYRNRGKTMPFVAPVFRDAKMESASFQDIPLKSPDFSGADLTRAIFSNCIIEQGFFNKANLRNATLVNSKMAGADFSNADLRGASFSGSDLAGAKFDGADLTKCNLRGVDLSKVDLSKAKGYDPEAAKTGVVGPALTELDQLQTTAGRIAINFNLRGEEEAGEGEPVGVDTNGLKYGWGVRSPFRGQTHLNHGKNATISDGVLLLAAQAGHQKVRFETVSVSSSKCSKGGKELKELALKGIAEAFAQEIPSVEDLAAATKAIREAEKDQKAAAKAQREEYKKRQEQLKKREAAKAEKTIAKEVGKVTDIVTFLKALELRADAEKIKKAMKMLKAEKFKLFSDIAEAHFAGVVKSQTDPDLVYACRIESDGNYACCTQNLNICGGLRGSVCKHLLVLIIGLVKAGELDPTTIDGWVAKTRDTKPELDKEVMGEIFIRYKGAEAGEVDWRPTETVPEDYYAL